MRDIYSKIDELEDLTLREEDLLEIARIGFTSDGYEVYINTDDPGNIPHFHYRKKGSWEGHTCIRLDKPEYFLHGNKQAILNNKQKKELIYFLSAKPLKAKKFGTNWEFLLSMWNVNNSDIEISEDVQMPDYNKLSGKVE